MIETSGGQEKGNTKVSTKKKKKRDVNPIGHPPIFKSAEEMQEKIDEYFDRCDNRVKEIYNKELGDHIMISNPEPYTVSGLAVALGTNRQTLLNYGEREAFFDTIKAAKARIEADVERRMCDKDTFTPGLIFSGKNNFGMRDKTETDLNHSGSVGVTMQITNFSTLKHDKEEN